MTFKEMPRVGGGHGSHQKIHPRLHRNKSQTSDQIFKGVMKEELFFRIWLGLYRQGFKRGI